MTRVVILFLALLFLPAQAGTKTKRWHLQYDGYQFAIATTPLGHIPDPGDIPNDRDLTGAEQVGLWAKDCPPFTYLRDHQSDTYWYSSLFFPEDPEQVYDGALSDLVLVLRDSTRVGVKEIIAMGIDVRKMDYKYWKSIPIYTLHPFIDHITFAQIEAYGRERFYGGYAGFPRSYDPKDVVGVERGEP